MEYSLIVPVYKAEKTLPLLIPSIVKAMEEVSGLYEVVLVDDCSPDKSWEILNALSQKYNQLRIVRLNKNYGQLAATTCGLQTAKGKVLLTMDDDLQFSPEEIPALIQYYNTHSYLLVFGIAEKKMNSKSLDYTRNIMRFLFKHVFLRKFRNIEYFSSFRILNSSAIHTGRLKNLFMIWTLNPNEIGNYAVNHFPTRKQLTSYTLIKRIIHFSPYIFLALKKTGFTLGLLAIGFMLLAYTIHAPLFVAASGIGALVFFAVGVTFRYINKKKERVTYTIDSLVENHLKQESKNG